MRSTSGDYRRPRDGLEVLLVRPRKATGADCHQHGPCVESARKEQGDIAVQPTSLDVVDQVPGPEEPAPVADNLEQPAVGDGERLAAEPACPDRKDCYDGYQPVKGLTAYSSRRMSPKSSANKISSAPKPNSCSARLSLSTSGGDVGRVSLT